MKKIIAILLFSMLTLAGLSIVASAQAGPDADITVIPKPLRVGDLMHPSGEYSTGNIANYNFFCMDQAGSEVTLYSGPEMWNHVVPASTYGVCCVGGTCEAGELITVSLEVTDTAGNTAADSETITIWPAPKNTDMHYINLMTPVESTEVALELMSGADILANYNGKTVFIDDRSGWDGRFGMTKDYPDDLVYPWANYAVAQSPFNSKLMVVISLDNVAGQPFSTFMDGKAIFKSDYPTFVWAAAIVENIDGRIEERWVRAMGNDIRGGSRLMPTATQSISLCAYAKPNDPKVPFVAVALPSDSAPLPPGGDCPPQPINGGGQRWIGGRLYQVEWKDSGYNMKQV